MVLNYVPYITRNCINFITDNITFLDTFLNLMIGYSIFFVV